MHNRNNRETVIIPQTIIVLKKSIIVASLVLNEAYCLPFSKHTQKICHTCLFNGKEYKSVVK